MILRYVHLGYMNIFYLPRLSAFGGPCCSWPGSTRRVRPPPSGWALGISVYGICTQLNNWVNNGYIINIYEHQGYIIGILWIIMGILMGILHIWYTLDIINGIIMHPAWCEDNGHIMGNPPVNFVNQHRCGNPWFPVRNMIYSHGGVCKTSILVFP
jgi:hypothetical protein